MCRARQAPGRVRSRVPNQQNIQLSTKLKVYKAVALCSLLYGCETWTLYRRHTKLLERFNMRSPRFILGISWWQDKITNLEILDRTETSRIKAIILKAQLRWTEHVVRMEDYSSSFMANSVLAKEIGKKPPIRYKDCVKALATSHRLIPPPQSTWRFVHMTELAAVH